MTVRMDSLRCPYSRSLASGTAGDFVEFLVNYPCVAADLESVGAGKVDFGAFEAEEE